MFNLTSGLPATEEIKYLQEYVSNLKVTILNSMDINDSIIEEMILLEKYLEKRIGNLRKDIKEQQHN